MENQKLKTVLLIILIIFVYIFIKIYVYEIGEEGYRMSFSNPVSALKLTLPCVVFGALICELGKTVREKKENLGKLLKFLGGFQIFGGILSELVSFIFFVAKAFRSW